MADQGYREIQLTGKQLVFLFMASVVVAVAVFLLGVSVGRGVGPVAGGNATAAETEAAPSDLPPATVMAPGDRDYHDALRETTPPAPARSAIGPAQSASTSLGSEPTPARAVTSTPAAPPTATPSAPPKASPAAPPTPPARSTVSTPVATPSPAPARATPAAGSGWSVQVGAYRSRANADRQAGQLKARGYAAYVLSGGPGSLFRVRVGPFDQRAEANRTAVRLRQEEGLKPSVTR